MLDPKGYGRVVAVCVVLIGRALFAATVATPAFSRPHGFYDSAVSVTISTATSGAQIRYTTDASTPTASHGTLYSGAITISGTTCLRAIATKSGMTASQTFTQTYIFLSDVLTQKRPAGYPTLWGTKTADYDMDPDIVNHASYSGTIKGDLKSIPSVSIVLPMADIFGADGIYHRGGGEGGKNTMETSASAEMIHPDGTTGFQINCGLKPHSWTVMKRSLRLLFKSSRGGPQTLDYPVFSKAVHHASGAATTFGKLILRGQLNDSFSWYHPDFRTPTTATESVLIRAQWARDTQLSMSGYGGRSLYVHLYLNGLYWGLYCLQERPDARWAATYRGGAKSDWFAANHEIEPRDSGTIISGSRSRHDYLHNTLTGQNFASASVYENVKKYLDIEAFCDYIALMCYIGKGDWPRGNYYCYGQTNPGGPLRYTDWDSDCSWRQDVSFSWDGAWVHPAFYASGRADYNHLIPNLWRKLDDNKDFLTTFADRVYKHGYNGGALTESNAKARWDDLCNRIDGAVVGESARWGDRCRDAAGTSFPVITRNDHWRPACTKIRNMMTGNVAQLISALRARGWYPSLDAPVYAKHGGTVAAGYKLTIDRNNSSGTLFYRGDGQDPRVSGGEVLAGSASAGASATLSLTETTTVMARVKNGATWSALAEARFAVTGSTVTPPAAPDNLAASAESSSRIRLTWRDNSSDETEFKLDRRASGAATWARIATLAANATSYTDSGLPAGTTYYYQVSAANTAGDSPASNVAGATTDAELIPQIAASPTTLSVSCEQGQDAADQTFDVWNGGTGTLRYKVVEATSKYDISPATGTSTGVGDKTTHTIDLHTADLAVGSHDRAFTIEDDGSGAANGPVTIMVQITITAPQQQPPVAPSDLTATASSSSRIEVRWTDNSSDETGFKLDRRLSGTSTWERIAEPAANATSYSDVGLSASTTYYYQVKANNAAGNSPYSNVAGAATGSEAVPQIAVSATTLSVSCEQGQDAADQTFEVWNGGTGTLRYKVVEATSKYDISPATGSSTGSGDKQTHTIDLHTADLAAGSHDRAFTIEDDGSGAANGPVTILVQIAVSEPQQQVPAAPENLRVTGTSASHIALAWDHGCGGQTGFAVERLAADGSEPVDVIVDNPDAVFVGDWASSSVWQPCVGDDYRHDNYTGKGQKTATYEPGFTSPRSVEVAMWYVCEPAHPDWFRASNVPVRVYHEGGTDLVLVNQKTNSFTWFSLGTYTMGPGHYAQIGTEDTYTNAAVIADAFRFRSLGASWEPVASTGPDARAWTDNEVAAGVTYRYRVKALSSAGDSVYSDTVEATAQDSAWQTLAVGLEYGTRDAEESLADGTISFDSSDLEMVTDGAVQQLVGLRFAGLTIPGGASIASAYVQFTADESNGEATELTIRADAADDSESLQGARLSQRTLTGARVSWAPAAWTAGEAGAAQRTPDLAAVIQEVVNRPGWATGNGLTLIIGGTGKRVAVSRDQSEPASARLYVQYGAGSATPPSAPGGLAAAAKSSTRIDLAWSDNSSDETGFKIDRRQSGTQAWVRIAELNADTTRYTDAGLPAATRFYYQVKAHNGAGNSPYSNLADATTAPADENQDGLPDAWQAEQFSKPGASDPEADPDGDGYSNLSEYVAGTGPEDGEDLLMVGAVLVDGRIAISFPTRLATGAGYEGLTRYYSLEKCVGLQADATWDAVPGFERIAGGGQVTTYTEPDAGAEAVLFRTRVWLE
ncbi:MAG: fibronectin type III domain-containing protein [Kiritimatiellae bacterium]|nr:fibronectin type III domain-containing protein [Kiritimatiellia bacterium]